MKNIINKIIEGLKEVLEENDLEVKDKILFEQAIKIYISKPILKEQSFSKEKPIENLPKMASEKQINFLKALLGEKEFKKININTLTSGEAFNLIKGIKEKEKEPEEEIEEEEIYL